MIQTKVNYDAYATNPADSWHGFSVTAIHLLTQNGVDTSEEQDVLNNQTWGSTGSGYSSGSVFVASNGVCCLFWPINNIY